MFYVRGFMCARVFICRQMAAIEEIIRDLNVAIHAADNRELSGLGERLRAIASLADNRLVNGTTHQGWLQKQGQQNRGFKRRYFVLRAVRAKRVLGRTFLHQMEPF
eukprot:SAG11_NODE_4641_length_1824_cov_1.761739_4_plen_106_part_00